MRIAGRRRPGPSPCKRGRRPDLGMISAREAGVGKICLDSRISRTIKVIKNLKCFDRFNPNL